MTSKLLLKDNNGDESINENDEIEKKKNFTDSMDFNLSLYSLMLYRKILCLHCSKRSQYANRAQMNNCKLHKKNILTN